LHSTEFGVYSERRIMTDENTDDLCKDCGPTFTAFLEGMADHNQEQMAEHARFTCPTCGKVHEYTFPYPPKAPVPPASAL
jgi:transposase-like protein